MLSCISSLLEAGNYHVRAYKELLPGIGGVPRLASRKSAAVEEHPSLLQWAGEVAVARSRAVIADQAWVSRHSREQLLGLLEVAVRKNLVRIQGSWFEQTKGVPQGAVPSALICSLVLGDLEANHVMPLLGGGQQGQQQEEPGSHSGRLTALAKILTSSGRASVQQPWDTASTSTAGAAEAPPLVAGAAVGVRLIDDFLYICLDQPLAERILGQMAGRLPTYGCTLNPAKTRLNFACKLDGQDIGPNEQVTGDGRRFVSWCGLLLESSRLEVQADYSRYLGEPLAAALNVARTRNPGRALPAKLRLYLSHKAYPLLLDPAVNPHETIQLNVYQCFLLAAMKMHRYLATLMEGSRITVPVKLILAAIRSSFAFFGAMAAGRVQRARLAAGMAEDGAAAFQRSCPSPILRCLGLHAFRVAFGRKQARYAAVLTELDRDLEGCEKSGLLRGVRQVVDPRRSNILLKINY